MASNITPRVSRDTSHAHYCPDVLAVLIQGHDGWMAVREGTFLVNTKAVWFGTPTPIFHFTAQYGAKVEGPLSSLLAIKSRD